MTPSDDVPITSLLARWRSGDRNVENALLAEIYPVLRDIARAQVRRHAGILSLQATELANEAYEKIFLAQSVDWRNRDHFYAIAATVVRRVVIDYVRERRSEKRGGGLVFVDLDSLTDRQSPTIDDSVDWLAIDQAITELTTVDPGSARIVELKFFSGLTAEQIAEVEGSSVATVGRQWRFARAWLGERLGVESSD